MTSDDWVVAQRQSVPWLEFIGKMCAGQHATPQEDNDAFTLANMIARGGQHITTQHNISYHNTTQRITTHHHTTQHNTTQHNTTQHITTQHNTTHHTATTAHNYHIFLMKFTLEINKKMGLVKKEDMVALLTLFGPLGSFLEKAVQIVDDGYI